MKITLLLVLAAVLLAVGIAGLWLRAPDRPRADLEGAYLADPGDYLEVAGLRLHLRDAGPRAAPAVILLHGFGASLHTWEGWAADLAADRRVISFDLPGFGLTGADPTGDYSDGRSIEVLGAVMDRLGLSRATLVGNSIGGRIAWTFAAGRPERVDRLVLVAPDGFASKGFSYGKAPDVPATARLMRFILPRPMVRANLAAAYGDPARLSEAAVTRYHDLLLAPGVREAVLARMAQVVLVPPEPLLRAIEAPTLLLWGERDRMIPPANAQDYLEALPDGRLVVLPGLGHVPQEEAPEASLAPVRAFLAERP